MKLENIDKRTTKYDCCFLSYIVSEYLSWTFGISLGSKRVI